MSAYKIAKRYAVALFDICESDDIAENVLSQLKMVSKITSEKEVNLFLANPEIKGDSKLDLVLELAKNINASDLLIKFFRVLSDASRLELLSTMDKPFEEILFEKINTVKATVTSVVSLDDADFEAVKKKVEVIVGKKVLLEQVVDTSILGGLVVRVGNNILDLSLKNKLDAMTKTAIG